MEGVRSLYRQQVKHHQVIEALKEGFADTWNTEDVQDAFIELVIRDEVVQKYPVRGTYKYAVLKQMVKDVESAGSATSDLLIEELCDTQTAISTGTNINNELVNMGRDLDYSFKSFTIQESVYSLKVWPEFSQVGLALWPAGYAVAEWVMEHSNELTESSVIVELGSGVGLTAVVAAHVTKAAKIVMTDYLQTVNENASQNLREFSFEPPRTVVEELDWEKVRDNHPATIDLIKTLDTTCLLAADVVYDRSVIPALVDTISLFLKCSPRLEHVVFAVTHRNEETFNILLSEIARCGLTLTQQPYPSNTNAFYYERDLIKIYGVKLIPGSA
eukprot:TRINITY_DN16993_c0_g1_i1.p1 TRINITY_DN16993_c0_g1~~TRINITY_DN16993_c0_g1_i1.p1  ORF type:complete len:330 (+),score=44.46 TRINITY_DN16993_c0_g1_i1:65-1054(+)